MKKKTNYLSTIISIIPFVFYIFFAFFDGYVWCDDTITYVTMSIVREPLYPTFLAIIRTIFGSNEEIYLNIAVIIQSLLTAYATYSLFTYIKKTYNLNTFLQIISMLILLSVSILCRFIAKRASMYSNSILSESLAYPFFLLFVKNILEYTLEHKNKSLIFASVLSFLMISTRKQMYITLMTIVICVVYVSIITKEYKNNIIKLLIVCILVFGGNKLFDFLYTSSVNGVNTTHTSDNRFLNTMVVYNCSKEDINLIEDEEVKKVFTAVYNECDSHNLLRSSITNENWYTRCQHILYSYDEIQESVWATEKDYIAKNYKLTLSETEILCDKYNDEIISSLIPSVIPSWLLTYKDNALFGLMITITADKGIFQYPALVIGILFITLLVFNIIKSGLNEYTIFGLLSSLLIVLNTFIYSIIIFNQTRYTIYNLGTFYTAYLLLIINTFKIIKNK